VIYASGKDQSRDHLKAAFIQRACAICDARAALEELTNRGVSLEALEFLEGGKPGVAVIQSHDEADRYEVFAKHVEPGPAIGIGAQSPSDGMPEEARCVLVLRDLPQFLEPRPIGLRRAVPSQLKLFG
jgi:hypothetical protein